MAQVDVPVQFTRWIGEDGIPTPYFYRFILNLWRRTGGGSDVIEGTPFENVTNLNNARLVNIEERLGQIGFGDMFVTARVAEPEFSVPLEARISTLEQRLAALEGIANDL